MNRRDERTELEGEIEEVLSEMAERGEEARAACHAVVILDSRLAELRARLAALPKEGE